MRSRNIKPGFFKNEYLAELKPLTRILFVGLWCYADKEGRFEWRPKKIKAEILPYDNGEITVMLQELHDQGFLVRYRAGENGEFDVGEVVNFKKHQSPHHTEKASDLPSLGSNGYLTVNSPCKDGGNPSDSLIPDSLIPDSKEYSASDEAAHASGNGSQPPQPSPEPHYLTKKKKKLTGKRLTTFNRFWAAFGYPKGKAEAADAWLAIPQLTEAMVDDICRAARREAEQRPQLIADGRTPKWAQGWITGRRWEDEDMQEVDPLKIKYAAFLAEEDGVTQ